MLRTQSTIHAVNRGFEILLELKAEACQEVARKASQCVHIRCPLAASAEALEAGEDAS